MSIYYVAAKTPKEMAEVGAVFKYKGGIYTSVLKYNDFKKAMKDSCNGIFSRVELCKKNWCK